MIHYIFVWKYFLFQFQQKIKQWAKPATLSLISGVILDLTRSRSDLIVENALLRQQLIVLHRQLKRPLYITTNLRQAQLEISHPRLSLADCITAILG